MTEALRIEIKSDGTRKVVSEIGEIGTNAVASAKGVDRLSSSIDGVASSARSTARQAADMDLRLKALGEKSLPRASSSMKEFAASAAKAFARKSQADIDALSKSSLDLAHSQSRAASEARGLTGALRSEGKEAETTGAAFKRLGGHLAVAFGARALVMGGDQLTEVANGLTAIAREGEDVAATMSELRRIGQDSRTGFLATGELYNRIAISASNLGATQSQMLDVTEKLSQAMKLSPGGMQAANGAMIQLTQGFSAGILRGEELNSILEGAPIIADLIAKEFGVARGELKKMGEEGKLAADRVFQGILKADGISSKFAKTIPTVSDEMTRLKDNVTSSTGALNTFFTTVLQGYNELLELPGKLDDMARGTDGLTGRGRQMAEIRADIAFIDGQIRNLDLVSKTAPGGGAAQRIKEMEAQREALRGNLKLLSEQYVAEGKALAQKAQLSGATGTFSGAIDELSESMQNNPLFVQGKSFLIGSPLLSKALKEHDAKVRKAADEWRRFKDSVESLESSLDDQLAAHRELTSAIELLDKAVAKKLITDERANELINLQADALHDRLNPGLKEAAENAALLGQRQLEVEFDRIEQGYDGVGESLEDMIKWLEGTAEAIKKNAEATETGSLQRYVNELKDVQGGLEDGIVSAARLAENALVDLFASGKMEADDFLRSLAQIGLQVGLRGLLGGGAGALGLRDGGTRTLGRDGMLHAQTGLEWTMPGSGGPDSRIVPLAMTPGERLTVETPGQQATRGRSDSAPAAPPVINNTVVVSAKDLAAILSTPQGRRELQNAVRIEGAALKRALR